MTVYFTLAADPAWGFDDGLGRRGADANYATMSLDDIKAFPLPPLERDAILFLWRVSAMVEEAYQVVRAWGFVPKTEMVWRKLTKNGKPWFGMGHYFRAAHETCVVATRGRVKVATRSMRSVFSARVPTDAQGRYIHSAKPEVFYDLVEELVPGPYAELFGRRQRAGWLVIGNQPEKRAAARPLTLFGYHDLTPQRGDDHGEGDRPQPPEAPPRCGEGGGEADPGGDPAPGDPGARPPDPDGPGGSGA